MKVFISWSGDLSKAIGQLVKTWVPTILNDVEFWFSPDDIKDGTRWMAAINEQLSEQTIGLAILTKENLESRWIHYECGALAKGLDQSRIFGICVEIEKTDVLKPIGDYNLTLPTKDGMFKFLQSINELLPRRVKDENLELAFSNGWNFFNESFAGIVKNSKQNSTVSAKRATEDVVKEILEVVRSMDKRMQSDETFSNSIRAVDFEDYLKESMSIGDKRISFKTRFLPNIVRKIPVKPMDDKAADIDVLMSDIRAGVKGNVLFQYDILDQDAGVLEFENGLDANIILKISSILAKNGWKIGS